MAKYRTEHQMKAHIQIVGWNHYHYIGTCILSCQKQTVSVPIIYIDNDSKDESVAYIRKNYPDVVIVENKENRGYAGGHNDGFKVISDSEVVICLNPDVVLEKDFVEKILQKFESEGKVGAVVPLLFRGKSRDKEGKMRIVVDSYGTRLRKNLNVENILEGEFWEETTANQGPTLSAGTDPGATNSLPQPWGFTGAAVAFSRNAINDLKDEKGNFFDEDLHSYREDVDISWRLNRKGWKIVGASDVRAWHARVARKGEMKSANIVRLSWRNYFLVVIKNVSTEMIKKNWFPFGVQILARIGQFVVTPQLWGGLVTFLGLIPLFLKKRKRALI
ncbi:MAG: glycosyltransferase family 2 protein [bacterium]|nr:glycosyltransferase family 2 protein [bacterium]